MKYFSVCSGIEAATAAWHPLGWEPVAFSEVEPFPSAVLAQHYPDVPNLGDMTQIDGSKYNGSVDLIVGGTPCQSFSVAGLRGGMEDPRGNLALAFLGLVDTIRPRYFVWENVPGVLSSSGGQDFGSFVGAVAQLGYRGGWRVLDARWFNLAQRRQRVFFVGCSPAAERGPREILFERESLRGDPPPSRGQREGTPSVLKIRAGCEGGGKGPLVGEDQSFTLATGGDQTLFAPIGLDEEQNARSVAFRTREGVVSAELGEPEVANALRGPNGGRAGEGAGAVLSRYSVRRLTPIECERLQGFPDDYTRIAWKGKAPEDCPDGPRYKALGNSMAVPVMRWIGSRIGD
jgi:DNA (cytosine-5)-methyltransferase 1